MGQVQRAGLNSLTWPAGQGHSAFLGRYAVVMRVSTHHCCTSVLEATLCAVILFHALHFIAGARNVAESAASSGQRQQRQAALLQLRQNPPPVRSAQTPRLRTPPLRDLSENLPERFPN